MATITLEVPDELARSLPSSAIEAAPPAGLVSRPAGAANTQLYSGVVEVLEFLADLPSPEELLQLRASEDLQRRVSALLAKNREEGLSAQESAELDQYEYLEHVVRIAKAKAQLRRNGIKP